MKKSIAAALMGLSLIGVNNASAQTNDGVCSVIGYHEPGTNTYDGPTFCNNTSLSYITVRGPAEFKQTSIAGKTDVSGPIKAINSTLQEVVIQNNLSAETVTLSEATTVSGDIKFLGREGIVYVNDTSNIKGKVINGKIVRQAK